MIHSPSIHTSVARLEAIRADNYIGAGGKEYSQRETDDLIWEKRHRKADAVDFVVADILANTDDPVEAKRALVSNCILSSKAASLVSAYRKAYPPTSEIPTSKELERWVRGQL